MEQNKNELKELVRKEQEELLNQAKFIKSIMPDAIFNVERFKKLVEFPAKNLNEVPKKLSWAEARFILNRLKENGLALSPLGVLNEHKDVFEINLVDTIRINKYASIVQGLKERIEVYEMCIEVIKEGMNITVPKKKTTKKGVSEKPVKSSAKTKKTISKNEKK